MVLNALVLAVPAFYFQNAEKQRADEFALAKARLVSESLRNGLITAMLEGRGQRFALMLESIEGGGLRSIELLDSKGNRINRHGDLDTTPPAIAPSSSQWTETLHTDIPIRRQNACLQCHPDSPDPLMAIMRVTIDRPSSQEGEVWARRALSVYALTVLASALLMAAISNWLYTRELSAQRANILKETSMKADKLANINEFASAIAHDIKNPLAGISGAIQVFAEDFPKEDKRSEIIQEVVDEIEKLDRSVKDLLSYARPPEPNRMPVLADDLIERAVSTMGSSANKQGVDIAVNSDLGQTMVEADPELIQQAFLNIMAFGLQAMPSGGKLSVAAHLSGKPGDRVQITISDTGDGLASQELKALFTPFTPARRTGVGLALAISRNILERHGGGISAESSPGSGTAFVMHLPVYKGNA